MAVDADPTPRQLSAADPTRCNPSALVSAGVAVVVVLAGLSGWLSYQLYQEHRINEQRNVFLQTGRETAQNLGTIDYTHADGDVERILAATTGTFHDDFQTRSPALVGVIKQARSKSVGSIVDAALESVQGDQARVLVAVNVTTSASGIENQIPRAWRLRMTVQNAGGGAKVSNVEFIT